MLPRSLPPPARPQATNFVSKFAHTEVFGKGRQSDPTATRKKSRGQVINEQLLLLPDSWPRFCWDVWLLVLIIFVSFELPLRLAFSKPPESIGWHVFDTFCDVLFFVDVVLNFRTAYVDDGTLVKSPTRIACHYLRTWFILDVASSLPWDWLVAGVPFTQTAEDWETTTSNDDLARGLNLLRTAKLFRLLRLLRITRLYRSVERWEEVTADGHSKASPARLPPLPASRVSHPAPPAPSSLRARCCSTRTRCASSS